MADYQSEENSDEVRIETDTGGEVMASLEAVEFARGILEAANWADPGMNDGRTTVIEAIGVSPDEMTDLERDDLSEHVHRYISQDIGIEEIADARGVHPDDVFLAVAVESGE